MKAIASCKHSDFPQQKNPVPTLKKIKDSAFPIPFL